MLDKHMLKALSSGCVICNIGYFDNEIDVEYLKGFGGMRLRQVFIKLLEVKVII